MRNGGWTLAKPNTISMPLPNLAAVGVPMSIGGVTYWNRAGDNLPVTLGDGTFLVYNMAYFTQSTYGIPDYYAPTTGDGGTLSEFSVKQGIGLTYPSGGFVNAGGSKVWPSYLNANYLHAGWAMKLSGQTSGGVGGGGAIQPL
jgi:hypothetical protein